MPMRHLVKDVALLVGLRKEAVKKKASVLAEYGLAQRNESG